MKVEVKVMITTTCPFCGENHFVYLTQEQRDAYRNNNEIPAELSADDRELLITGICSECWEKTFSDDEEM